jgi:undecaprenyl diphosphate synthase
MVLEQLGKIAGQISGQPQQSQEEVPEGIIVKTPQHIAMTMEGISTYARMHNEDFPSCYKRSFVMLKNLIEFQVKSSIPIITVQVIPETMKRDTEHYPVLLDALEEFLTAIVKEEVLHKNKVKISVLGKWYDMPGKVIDPIKTVLDETKDYDQFFFNLCINYNGQEEIADACRLVARQVKAGKIDPNSITKDTIKESCYSSYFIPPNLFIKTGLSHSIPGLLLWDSSHAKIFFARKHWPELKIADLLKAIKEYQNY